MKLTAVLVVYKNGQVDQAGYLFDDHQAETFRGCIAIDSESALPSGSRLKSKFRSHHVSYHFGALIHTKFQIDPKRS